MLEVVWQVLQPTATNCTNQHIWISDSTRRPQLPGNDELFSKGWYKIWFEKDPKIFALYVHDDLDEKISRHPFETILTHYFRFDIETCDFKSTKGLCFVLYLCIFMSFSSQYSWRGLNWPLNLKELHNSIKIYTRSILEVRFNDRRAAPKQAWLSY